MAQEGPRFPDQVLGFTVALPSSSCPVDTDEESADWPGLVLLMSRTKVVKCLLVFFSLQHGRFLCLLENEDQGYEEH